MATLITGQDRGAFYRYSHQLFGGSGYSGMAQETQVAMVPAAEVGQQDIKEEVMLGKDLVIRDIAEALALAEAAGMALRLLAATVVKVLSVFITIINSSKRKAKRRCFIYRFIQTKPMFWIEIAALSVTYIAIEITKRLML